MATKANHTVGELPGRVRLSISVCNQRKLRNLGLLLLLLVALTVQPAAPAAAGLSFCGQFHWDLDTQTYVYRPATDTYYLIDSDLITREIDRLGVTNCGTHGTFTFEGVKTKKLDPPVRLNFGSWKAPLATEKIKSFNRIACVGRNAECPAEGSARPAPAMNLQQIQFNPGAGRKLTYLRVEGLNQNNQNVVYEHRFSTPLEYPWIIKDWWWQGTLLIGAEIPGIGRIACVVDYIPPSATGGSSVFPVEYYGPGQGCSSASGVRSIAGVFEPKKMAKILEAYIEARSISGSVKDLRALARSRYELSKLPVDSMTQGELRKVLSKTAAQDVRIFLDQFASLNPECLFAIGLALPIDRNSGLPLTKRTAQMCSAPMKAANDLLGIWGLGKVKVMDR